MIPLAKPYLSKEESEAASAAILSGWITQGMRVKEFEERFAGYTGSKYAVAVSNCTMAITLSLIAAGIKPGDEIICPSYSYIATANAIIHAGGIPVFADVDVYGNLNPVEAEKKITGKTFGILVAHQLGFPADIDAFALLGQKYGVQIFEDAACAAGSEYHGKKIGSHSDFVCFSFHPRKVITTGEGGIICTGQKEFSEKLSLLRHHGMDVTDLDRHKESEAIFENHVIKGFNARMTDIQAAIGIQQLGRLDWLVAERRKIANRYHEDLSGIDPIELPLDFPGTRSNFQSYPIKLKNADPNQRDKLIRMLRSSGISAKRGVMSIHREKAYREFNSLKLPVSEHLSDTTFLVPLWVGMTEDETGKVIATIREALKNI